jgi:glucokinase
MKQQVVLGIDIGGTNTSLGIVNRAGQILAQVDMPTKGDTVEDFIAALKDRIDKLVDEVGDVSINGAGLGAPNANYFSGEIAHAPNLPWKGIIPIAKLLGAALHLKVTITNDAKAAALGEMMYGAARGMKDFILITLGTGVGSGFIVNGNLIYGHDGFAGELGHTTVVRDGRKCPCGRNGCLERYTSATGIVVTAEEWLAERNDETILRHHKGKLTAKHIHEAADKGDKFAIELFDYTGMMLGQALANTAAITSPEAIIFFGGLAQAGELIMKPVRKHLEANLLFVYKHKIKLLQSALSDADAAILGASALAW